jgi:hypothetical protein
MTEKEKNLHRQVAGSLRLIEKSQRKFERDQDQIRSYEKQKKSIIYESDDEDDGYPKCKVPNVKRVVPRFKTPLPESPAIDEKLVSALYR